MFKNISARKQGQQGLQPGFSSFVFGSSFEKIEKRFDWQNLKLALIYGSSYYGKIDSIILHVLLLEIDSIILLIFLFEIDSIILLIFLFEIEPVVFLFEIKKRGIASIDV